MILINKLLWSGRKKWQIVGAAIGAFIGLMIMLGALQIYFDLRQIMGGDAEANRQYIIINKPVTLFTTLGTRSTFAEEEITDIKNQRFIKSAAAFTPNQFRVNATSDLFGFYTELFFESLPNDFVDVKTGAFQWMAGQKELPIIISRDYLALYNFGFAPSQGLPQFNEETIGRVTININIKGRQGGETFLGRIVGFSDRVNSILVPQTFMDWANLNYGNNTKALSSRLMVQTKGSSMTDLGKYIQDKGYELSSGRLIDGQLGIILRLITGLIIIIGLIILLLSLAVSALNFQLLISQASRDIKMLLQMGYKSNQISFLLVKNLGILFGIIFVSSLLALFLLRYIYVSWATAHDVSLSASLHWLVILLAVLIAFAFFALTAINIKRSVERLY